MLFLCVLWCRRTSCDISVLSSTSRRGATWALCQKDGWGQTSCHWLAIWKILPVWSRRIRASKTGFSPTVHSSMSCLNYILTHIIISQQDMISYSLCSARAYNWIFHHVPNIHVSACVYPSLPTDVATTVYSVGAQDDHGWASLLHTYNISLSAAQQSKILFALTCSKDTNKLLRYIDFFLLRS